MEPMSLARGAVRLVRYTVLLMLLAVPQHVLADEPQLVIRLNGDESAVYWVAEIERISFEDTETLVVVTAGGSDYYAASSIIQIEFLWETSAVDDPEEAAGILKSVHLFQNLPNPFSPKTKIGFELPLGGEVELGIYSPEGRLVRTLVAGTREAGQHQEHWDGRNDAGRKVSSGVYFYNLRAPGVEESRRMILLP